MLQKNWSWKLAVGTPRIEWANWEDQTHMTTGQGTIEKMKKKLSDQLLNIEHNPAYNDDQKVSKIINTTAVVCAALAIQPIPFADIFILTPIQGVMGYKIGQIRGVDLKKESMGNILKYIFVVVGLGVAAQQTAIGLLRSDFRVSAAW